MVSGQGSGVRGQGSGVSRASDGVDALRFFEKLNVFFFELCRELCRSQFSTVERSETGCTECRSDATKLATKARSAGDSETSVSVVVLLKA